MGIARLASSGAYGAGQIILIVKSSTFSVLSIQIGDEVRHVDHAGGVVLGSPRRPP